MWETEQYMVYRQPKQHSIKRGIAILIAFTLTSVIVGTGLLLMIVNELLEWVIYPTLPGL